MAIVYFLKANNAVKIGHTVNLEKRLIKLQTGNHNKLEVLLTIPMPDSKQAHTLEQHFHRWFRVYNIRKEWFRYSNLMQRVIKAINEDGLHCVAQSLEVSHRFFTADG